MLLRDPYAINVICGSILKTLSTLMQHEKLPRVSEICICTAHVLLIFEDFHCIQLNSAFFVV